MCTCLHVENICDEEGLKVFSFQYILHSNVAVVTCNYMTIKFIYASSSSNQFWIWMGKSILTEFEFFSILKDKEELDNENSYADINTKSWVWKRCQIWISQWTTWLAIQPNLVSGVLVLVTDQCEQHCHELESNTTHSWMRQRVPTLSPLSYGNMFRVRLRL